MYSQKVLDHFQNPRNVGEIENADGVGQVGNPICGDVMKLWIKVDKNGIITDAKFKTFGCAAAIASSSIATELIIGKHVDEAKKLSNKAIAEALGGLPPQKLHCSVLAADAIARAVDNYKGITISSEEEIVCHCNNITKAQIEDAILNGATSLQLLKDKLGVTDGACGGVRCKDRVEQILAEMMSCEEKEEKQ